MDKILATKQDEQECIAYPVHPADLVYLVL